MNAKEANKKAKQNEKRLVTTTIANAVKNGLFNTTVRPKYNLEKVAKELEGKGYVVQRLKGVDGDALYVSWR